MKSLSIILATALLCAACSSNPAPTTPQTCTSDSIQVRSDAPQEDASLAFRKGEYSKSLTVGLHPIEVEIDCYMPVAGLPALVRNINAWECRMMNDSTSRATYDVRARIKQYGQSVVRDFTSDAKESDEADFPYSFEQEIEVLYEDDLYVTLECKTEGYSGGAHGWHGYEAATFRKSDGKQMDWELLADMSLGQIQKALKKGLMKYFDVSTEADLRDNLLIDFLDENADKKPLVIPHPQTPPFLTKKGVQVVYQNYEIACYAAGMPSCIIKPN